MSEASMTAIDEQKAAAKPAFPSLWLSIGLVVLFIPLQLIAGIFVLGAAIALDSSGRGYQELIGDLSFVSAPTIISLIVANLIMLLLIWLYIRKDDRMAQIGLTRWSKLPLLHTIIWAVALIGAGLAFNYLYATYVIPDVKVQEVLRKLFEAMPDTIANMVMLFFAVAVLAPVLEELLFRGLLQNALKHKLPIWGAIIVSGMIFGAVHMDYHAFPALAVMGMAFGLLYHLTGSLRLTILAHVLNNAAALAFT
jgi:uncharacterized protein